MGAFESGNRASARLTSTQRAELAALVEEIKAGRITIFKASQSSSIKYTTLWRAARKAGCGLDGRKVLKLSSRQAIEAAEMHAAGLSEAAIARTFGVGRTAVRSAVKSREQCNSATTIRPRS